MPTTGWNIDGPRVEATREQWKTLYSIADRVRNMEPWKALDTLNLIIVKVPDRPDLYFSVLGHLSADHLRGVNTYEGADELNSCLMQALHVEVGLPSEYVLQRQNSLAGYFMPPDKIGDAAAEIVEQAGTETDSTLWPYFLSYRPGFFPAIPDADEVDELIRRYGLLEKALTCFGDSGLQLEGNDVFVCEQKDEGEWTGKAAPFPANGFRLLVVTMEDGEYTRRLTMQPHVGGTLQMDAVITDVPVADPLYNRICNPAVILMMDAETGQIVGHAPVPAALNPGEGALHRLAEYIVDYGIPDEVQVSNVELYSCLQDICERCEITLTHVPVMPDMVVAGTNLRRSMHGEAGDAVYMGVHEGLLS